MKRVGKQMVVSNPLSEDTILKTTVTTKLPFLCFGMFLSPAAEGSTIWGSIWAPSSSAGAGHSRLFWCSVWALIPSFTELCNTDKLQNSLDLSFLIYQVGILSLPFRLVRIIDNSEVICVWLLNMVCDMRRYSVNRDATNGSAGFSMHGGVSRWRGKGEMNSSLCAPARLHASGVGRAAFSDFIKVLCGLAVAQ